MPSVLSGFNLKTYLVAGVIVIVAGYIGYLKLDSKSKEIELIQKEKKIEEVTSERDEANKNNELIIKAYEQTLAIEKEKNIFEITTQKEKEPLIKISEKVKQEAQNVKKYKEVKQDEKECPKLGTFKL